MVLQEMMMMMHELQNIVTIAVILISCTAKIVVRVLRRHIKKKTEDTLGDQFGFRWEEGTRDANKMLRIISEWTVGIDENYMLAT